MPRKQHIVKVFPTPPKERIAYVEPAPKDEHVSISGQGKTKPSEDIA